MQKDILPTEYFISVWFYFDFFTDYHEHTCTVLFIKDTAELFFDDVRLPASALLGQANKGFYYLMQVRAASRCLHVY